MKTLVFSNYVKLKYCMCLTHLTDLMCFHYDIDADFAFLHIMHAFLGQRCQKKLSKRSDYFRSTIKNKFQKKK